MNFKTTGCGYCLLISHQNPLIFPWYLEMPMVFKLRISNLNSCNIHRTFPPPYSQLMWITCFWKDKKKISSFIFYKRVPMIGRKSVKRESLLPLVFLVMASITCSCALLLSLLIFYCFCRNSLVHNSPCRSLG